MSLLAHSAEDPADGRAYLLNNGTARRYHSAVTESVTRISAKIAGTTRPFTGITVDGLTPTVSGVDLDAPLHDAAAALDELEEVYLRDAVYFHHPRYLAHLNCPVVIPALVGEAVLSAVNSSLDTWDQSAGGTLIEQPADRLDGRTDRPGRGGRRHLHQRRQPVQPPGHAARPRRGLPPGADPRGRDLPQVLDSSPTLNFVRAGGPP